MHDLGAYPYIREGEGKILVEVYETPEAEYNETSRMEMGAGYAMKEVNVNLDGQTHVAEVYYATADNKFYNDEKPLVPNGDWIKHVAEKGERNHW